MEEYAYGKKRVRLSTRVANARPEIKSSIVIFKRFLFFTQIIVDLTKAGKNIHFPKCILQRVCYPECLSKKVNSLLLFAQIRIGYSHIVKSFSLPSSVMNSSSEGERLDKVIKSFTSLA